MGLPVREQLKYWGIAGIAFLVILWVLGDVLLPFVLGAAVAYFLDPVADKLEDLGCSRVLATAIITLTAILIFVVAALLVVPTLVSQSAGLISSAPQYAADFGAFLTDRFPSLLDESSTLRQSLNSVGETVQSRGGEFLNTALSSAASLINVVVLFVIVPVVSVYLLLDWDNMIARIDQLLPRDHAPIIRRLAGEIDATLASFIRGMGTVCLILGTFYAVALMGVGLQFGLVVGFIAGLVTFIPYLGSLIGGALALGLAFFQYWNGIEVVENGIVTYSTDWLRIAIVGGIFVVGQVVEGNVLTPKWVGKSVGLHPVWLIFALSVFGSIFGFVGMLVAVPLAASLGVIIRYVIERYNESLLYQGKSGLGD
ncbi:AI-2E family transporter [Pseudosulfitobacter sp. SM2401]|uniref:AI-2E family transporter n=1 Tax=Pseudosulfitobacter sp. SM2401 TaxID=3350098 RepID=UPI0036F22496